MFHVPGVGLKVSVGSCGCMQERCAFGWTAKLNINLVLSFPGLSPGKLLQTIYTPKKQLFQTIYTPKKPNPAFVRAVIRARTSTFSIASATKQLSWKPCGLRQPSKHGGRSVDLALQKAQLDSLIGRGPGDHSMFHVPGVGLKVSVGSCGCMQERCAFGWTAKLNINLVVSFPGLSPGKLLQTIYIPKKANPAFVRTVIRDRIGRQLFQVSQAASAFDWFRGCVSYR